jgi:ubiquinone/menaquinone biosynthesis C-methylase UbiE
MMGPLTKDTESGGRTVGRSSSDEQQYWDDIAHEWTKNAQDRVWRAHSDAVNTRLCDRWLSGEPVRNLLKTDLFDEAVGEGLWDFLRSRADVVMGMDVSIKTLREARPVRPRTPVTCADVRQLPFASDSFDAVISNSTLDHFHSLTDMAASLKELSRIMRPGGRLVITIDNLANPAIALRNFLPFGWLHRFGVVPYYVGATCGPIRLKRMLEDAGLEVLESMSILHCPRVIGVIMARWLQIYATPNLQARFGNWLMKWECLARFPTRYLTGNFVAIHCLKPDRGGA